ncbi:MAG: hypothetical protein LLG45_08380 [Actinomycetia bacterium]|nr:hypothetical protein [Actinomycetes bacterium]
MQGNGTLMSPVPNLGAMKAPKGELQHFIVTVQEGDRQVEYDYLCTDLGYDNFGNLSIVMNGRRMGTLRTWTAWRVPDLHPERIAEVSK